jgi:signal transduction histidine kinase
MDRDDATPVDLLGEIRAALDRVDRLLRGRVVDIEMARLRVVTNPEQFQRAFAELVTAAVAEAGPANAITVRVTRAGSTANIEVMNENSPVGQRLSLPLAPGTSSAADG